MLGSSGPISQGRHEDEAHIASWTSVGQDWHGPTGTRVVQARRYSSDSPREKLVFGSRADVVTGQRSGRGPDGKSTTTRLMRRGGRLLRWVDSRISQFGGIHFDGRRPAGGEPEGKYAVIHNHI